MAERLDNAAIYAGETLAWGLHADPTTGGVSGQGVRPLVLRDEKQAIVANPVTIPV